MLFKRAKAMGVGEGLRLMLWPRRSWSRSIKYIFLRLKRVPASPHKIALGAAIGVFAVFTPFLGGQLILASALALMLRGSVVASFLASFVGNPLTYPLIWFTTFNLGNVMLGANATGRGVDLRAYSNGFWQGLTSGDAGTMLDAFAGIWPIIFPMAIGSLPLGIFAAAASYVGVRWLIGGDDERKPATSSLTTLPQI